MIKSPFTVSELARFNDALYKDIIAEFDIRGVIAARPADEITPVLNFISNNLDDFLKGHPRMLESLIGSIAPLAAAAKANYEASYPGLNTRAINLWFKNEILRIFNYDFNHNSFTKARKGEMAYKHAQRLNLTTCPYCNAQFTFSIKNRHFKTRPHFDHFFSKSKHPYFALSFFNLIPSCYVCNSSIKGSKEFLYSSHLHPFFDSMDGLYRFRTNISSVDFLVDKKDFKIVAEPVPGGNIILANKAKRSIEEFQIEDRYNYHKDYAGEIITKSYFYNHSTIKELFEDYEIRAGVRLFSSEEEIIELLFGNYIHENKLHKRILSKITKDIAEEFGVKL